MQKIAIALLAATVSLAPALSFADSADSQVSRAEVVAHLSDLEQAGYQPAGANINYPVELRKAQRKISEAIADRNTVTTAQVLAH